VHRRAVFDTVDRVVVETGVTLIFVTQHAKEVPQCIRCVIHLKSGRVAKTNPRA
jgi:ABC-type molybdenum transport system ATPase subunit/photorepair protein PhrA